MAKRRAVIYQNMFPKKDSVLVDSLRQLMAPPAQPLTPVAQPQPATEKKVKAKAFKNH